MGRYCVPTSPCASGIPGETHPHWQLLVKVIEPGEDFDRVAGGAGRLEASAHGRMERLPRQTGVPAGLLCNGCSLRIVSAPRSESSGWLDLHVADMVTTAGRPFVAALRLLLSQTRLLSLPRDKRFAALLAESRRFQNEVSERLAEQVPHALSGLRAIYNTLVAASVTRVAERPHADGWRVADPTLDRAQRIGAALRERAPNGWRGFLPKEQEVKRLIYQVVQDTAMVERLFAVIKARAEY